MRGNPLSSGSHAPVYQALAYAGAHTDSADASSAEVYVLRDDTPSQVRIQTGSTDGQNTRVLAGLQAGDQVIVGGPGPVR